MICRMRYLHLTVLKRTFQFQNTRSFCQNMSAKRIAICQMTSGADKAANLEVVSRIVSDAAKENVQMMFFPEACDYICDNKKDVVAQAEPIMTGFTVGQYRELAAKHNVWMSMGGVHEKDENNPSKMFNTHVIIDNKGEIVQTYRKLHLFDVEIPEKGVRLKESDFCTPGGEIVTPVDTPVGRVGMAICYDMRFPEMGTYLAIMGADILTYPSAFTHATGLAHWHVLLRSRAIENQCYVVAAAQTGQHNAKRTSYGHAICVDPWGTVQADCENEIGFKVVEISPETIARVRRDMPVFTHRRRDVYSLYALGLRKNQLPEHSKQLEIEAGQSDKSGTDVRQSPGPENVFGHVRVPESCVFFKSELSYAFVNLRCVIPGHVLVAPIRCAERNQDLTEREADDFFKTIRLVQKLMEKIHKTESCTVTIQDGPDAGQTVKHLHCHIMPRRKGDFIQNDLIYLELAKHDQWRGSGPSKPARTLEEMQAEANMLKKELASLLKSEAASA